VFTCKTSGTNKVSASGTVRSLQKTAKLNEIESEHPQKILVNNGISGKDSTLFQFIISGFGEISLTYKAEKGGTLHRKVQLKEQFVPKEIEHKRAIPAADS
jgi:hypothetical protein